MSCENCEESAYVIERMGKLLAEIAIAVNGPEPPLTRWSYHDLPAKVRALRQAQQPAALAEPRLIAALEALADYVDERVGDSECRPLENARAAIAAAERKAGES